MWATIGYKLLEILAVKVLLPLAEKAILALLDWANERFTEFRNNKDIQQRIDELKNAETKEAKEDALRKIVQGVRNRRSSNAS